MPIHIFEARCLATFVYYAIRWSQGRHEWSKNNVFFANNCQFSKLSRSCPAASGELSEVQEVCFEVWHRLETSLQAVRAETMVDGLRRACRCSGPRSQFGVKTRGTKTEKITFWSPARLIHMGFWFPAVQTEIKSCWFRFLKREVWDNLYKKVWTSRRSA